MSVRLIVRVTNYAENSPLQFFKTLEVESSELEKLLRMDYSNRAHAEVIGAELLPNVGPRENPVGYAVLSEVAKWALAGHITESGVTVEAGQAIRAVACGVDVPQGGNDGR